MPLEQLQTLWEDTHNMHFYFRDADLNKIKKAPYGKMIDTALKELEYFGEHDLVPGLGIALYTVKQMQDLPKQDQPGIVISEEDWQNYNEQRGASEELMSPMYFHGFLACEAMVLFANKSMTNPSRAQECILQNQYRLAYSHQMPESKDIKQKLMDLRQKVDRSDIVSFNSLVAVRNARVSINGFISFKNYDIRPLTSCTLCKSLLHVVGEQKPTEVIPVGFVATEVYGLARYHDFIESIAKILPYVEELKARYDVQIVVGGLLNMSIDFLQEVFEFPLQRFRIIQNDIDMNFAIMPTPSSHCFFPGIKAIRHYQDRVLRFLSKNGVSPSKDKTILVIKRWQDGRRITNHDDLVRSLEDSFPDFRVVVFDRFQSVERSYLHMFTMFHQADAIVAPHGMGLANVIASRPGTLVLEFQPYRNVVACFARIVQALGLQYHGIVLSRETHYMNPMSVDISHTINILKKLL